MNIGIYIHIPFCKSKCSYCDFLSFVPNNESEKNLYVDYLIKEIKLNSKNYKNRCVDSIYFGGGTPSFIGIKNIERIMNALYDNFNIEINSENTLEINPGSTEDDLYKNLSCIGINRASLGLQTSDDRIIKLLNRSSSYEKFLDAINILRKNNLENISADLMLALPQNSKERELEDVKMLVNMDIKHISCYSLIIHPETKLYQLIKNKVLTLPDEEDERERYHVISDYLIYNKYRRYELSNFAISGFESRHNKKYWNLEEYLQLGLGAAGFIEGERRKNFSNLKYYYASIDKSLLPYKVEYKLSKKDFMSEYSFLKIREFDGIDVNNFKNIFGEDFFSVFNLDKHFESGLIIFKDGKVKLTEKGVDLSNLVEVDLVL